MLRPVWRRSCVFATVDDDKTTGRRMHDLTKPGLLSARHEPMLILQLSLTPESVNVLLCNEIFSGPTYLTSAVIAGFVLAAVRVDQSAPLLTRVACSAAGHIIRQRAGCRQHAPGHPVAGMIAAVFALLVAGSTCIISAHVASDHIMHSSCSQKAVGGHPTTQHASNWIQHTPARLSSEPAVGLSCSCTIGWHAPAQATLQSSPRSRGRRSWAQRHLATRKRAMAVAGLLKWKPVIEEGDEHRAHAAAAFITAIGCAWQKDSGSGGTKQRLRCKNAGISLKGCGQRCCPRGKGDCRGVQAPAHGLMAAFLLAACTLVRLLHFLAGRLSSAMSAQVPAASKHRLCCLTLPL